MRPKAWPLLITDRQGKVPRVFRPHPALLLPLGAPRAGFFWNLVGFLYLAETRMDIDHVGLVYAYACHMSSSILFVASEMGTVCQYRHCTLKPHGKTIPVQTKTIKITLRSPPYMKPEPGSEFRQGIREERFTRVWAALFSSAGTGSRHHERYINLLKLFISCRPITTFESQQGALGFF